MRLIDAEPIERALFRRADKSLAKNPYENAKICAFRRAFELVLDAPTITFLPNDAPPNAPLTLEELREMDGEPVWVELIGIKRPSAWYLLNLRDKEAVNKRGGFVSLIYYGDTWLAYRRRLEEEPI